MSHSGGDMDMGSSCSTAMLWNWNTIGTCFLAESWKIETKGMMAATCIGLFLLSIVLEGIRRAGREYDRFILRQFKTEVNARVSMAESGDNCSGEALQASSGPVLFRATLVQQLIRSVIYAVAFGIAYILMLVAMSYNGYTIIVIIVGTGFGKFLCDWTTQDVMGAPVQPGKDTGEPAMCRG